MVLLIVDRSSTKKGDMHIKDIVLARMILTWSVAVKEEKQARATIGSFVRCCTLYNLDPERVYGEAYIGETPLPSLVDTPKEIWMVTREEKGFIDADVALAVQSRQQHGVPLDGLLLGAMEPRHSSKWIRP